MKNTNSKNVEKVLNQFVNYVDMINDDQVVVPRWMNDLGRKVQSQNAKTPGEIYAQLRHGMMQEYGAHVASDILNNTFAH